MEKLIYTLRRETKETAATWRNRLCGPLAREMAAAGARSLQINVVDDAVAAGMSLRIASQETPDGFVSFWMESARERVACERLLAATHPAIAGYLVTESCIKDDRRGENIGDRSFGFSLISFLQRPPRLFENEWLRIFMGKYTAVAIETQSTFRYVQNVVARPLTPLAPPLTVILEEGFPPEALTSVAALYDAAHDERKFIQNWRRMVDCCRRFMDFDSLERLPMSEYRLADDALGDSA